MFWEMEHSWFKLKRSCYIKKKVCYIPGGNLQTRKPDKQKFLMFL